MKTIFIVTTRLQENSQERKIAQVAFESISEAARWIEGSSNDMRKKYLFNINEIQLIGK